MSRHHYTSDDGSVEREYLLDVNPWIWERVRGDGNNVIDARWVDVRNGLYVDITGIAETRPAQPGILNCKNYHVYRVSYTIFHLPVDVRGALCAYILTGVVNYLMRETLTNREFHRQMISGRSVILSLRAFLPRFHTTLMRF